MDNKDESWQELMEADNAEQVGYVRYLCEKRLGQFPDHGPTLIVYARTLIELGQYNKARKAIEHARSVVPTNKLHLVEYQLGHLSVAQGQFIMAINSFMHAHEMKPDDATGLIYAASAAHRMGDIDQAQTLARSATTCAEGCIDEAYFNLGGYLLSDLQYEEARECYVKALEIDPDYTMAKKRLRDIDLILGLGR